MHTYCQMMISKLKSPNHMNSILISSLSTLPSPNLSRLSAAVSSLSRRRLRRLTDLLSSPTLFSLTLRRLRSLSLLHKSLLISRHLLATLLLLHRHFPQNDAVALPNSPLMKLRDLDKALLLLLLCEVQQHDRLLLDAPLSRWRAVLSNYLVSNSILRISNFGGCSRSDVLVWYIESVGRCWNLVDVIIGGGEGKEVPAAAAAVVALPSLEASGGTECAICREEMRDGREVCRLPCRHLFHWMCVLQWLQMRDTCPCCRRRLPTDDVRREIERLLDDLSRIGGGGRLNHEYCS